ncbi:hypothetical protein ACFL55_02190 [Candidatus Latescibacterota bacterium]
MYNRRSNTGVAGICIFAGNVADDIVFLPGGIPMDTYRQPVRFSRRLLIPLLVCSLMLPVCLNAWGAGDQGDRSTPFSPPRLEAWAVHSTLTDNQQAFREQRCLSTARWIGALSGSFMGVAQLCWSATGVSGVHGSFGKNLLTGIPSIIVGSYVGTRTTEWMTRKIMEGNPKPGNAALKGALYGAVNGTVILTASLIPLLIVGHYTETIHFNISDDMIVLKLIGASAAGGMVYGGTFGLLAGSVYGPCISMYMRY